MSISIVENRDCLEAMKEFPDKFFDLAIVDPPYAINRFKNGENSRLRKYGQMDSVNNARPSKEYFDELFRVSKNQIVWGFNHLCDLLPPHNRVYLLVQTPTCRNLLRWGTCLDFFH